MKTLLVLLLLIPSLSWGLTFKNGEQTEDDTSNSYEKSNNPDKAKKYYKESAKFSNTYYGQLSFQKIKPFEDFELVDDSKYSKEFEKEFNENPLTKHVILLHELNKTKSI